MTVNTNWCLPEWVRVCKEYSSAEHHWSRGTESQQPRTIQSEVGTIQRLGEGGKRCYKMLQDQALAHLSDCFLPPLASLAVLQSHGSSFCLKNGPRDFALASLSTENAVVPKECLMSMN